MAENTITIEQVEASVKSNNDSILSRLNALTAIEGVLSTIYGALSGLVSNVDKINTDISLLQASVDSVNAKVFDIIVGQNEIKQGMIAIGEKVNTDKDTAVIDTITKQNEVILQQIVDIKSKPEINIDSMSNKIESISGDIKNIETKITDIKDINISSDDIKTITDSVIDIIRENNGSLAENFNSLSQLIIAVKERIENSSGVQVEEFTE